MIGSSALPRDVQKVLDQDQTTRPVDFYFSQIKGAPTTVATDTAFEDYTVELTSAAGCTIGNR